MVVYPRGTFLSLESEQEVQWQVVRKDDPSGSFYLFVRNPLDLGQVASQQQILFWIQMRVCFEILVDLMALVGVASLSLAPAILHQNLVFLSEVMLGNPIAFRNLAWIESLCLVFFLV